MCYLGGLRLNESGTSFCRCWPSTGDGQNIPEAIHQLSSKSPSTQCWRAGLPEGRSPYILRLVSKHLRRRAEATNYTPC